MSGSKQKPLLYVIVDTPNDMSDIKQIAKSDGGM